MARKFSGSLRPLGSGRTGDFETGRQYSLRLLCSLLPCTEPAPPHIFPMPPTIHALAPAQHREGALDPFLSLLCQLTSTIIPCWKLPSLQEDLSFLLICLLPPLPLHIVLHTTARVSSSKQVSNHVLFFLNCPILCRISSLIRLTSPVCFSPWPPVPPQALFYPLLPTQPNIPAPPSALSCLSPSVP